MAMAFRRPKLQSQFSPRDSTSAYDCGAAVGAMIADADSRGEEIFNHSQVRRATNEPRPDPGRPGLTIEQVANSLLRLTDGAVAMDVHSMGSSFSVVKDSLQQGKWAHLAVWRGVLVDAGWAGQSPFRGAHAMLYGYDQLENDWIAGDPLVPYWMRIQPGTMQRACRGFHVHLGQTFAALDAAYFGLSRDVFSEEDPGPPDGGGEVMFNVGPINTHRDALVKKGAILYANSALTDRHSVVDEKKDTPFGFNGSGQAFHVIINSGNTNYVRRADVIRIYPHEREFE